MSSIRTTPVSGATVKVLNHPEYGQTLTRSDGFYDLAVNGGSALTVNIAKAGSLPVQRRAVTKYHGTTVIDDVVFTSPQPAIAGYSTFTPGLATAQIVRGMTTPSGADADPARQAVLYFPPNTTITNATPPAGALNVEITEFTGTNGLARMPGDLPPTSGYTYAVELSLLQVTALGVPHPAFSKDVVLYVDNFTGAPIGEPVPTGSYDETNGAWDGEDSGRIIKIVSISGGMANIDITGDNVADSVSALAAIGIDASERTKLAGEYPAGKQLWRTSLSHFSSWDLNWGYGLPPGAQEPPPQDANDDSTDDPCKKSGSIIGCENRTLGETLPIVGTPFSLNYQSERAAGYKRQLQFRITDATPLVLQPKRAIVTIDVAGKRSTFIKQAPLVPNIVGTFNWDGADAYGRQLNAGTYDVTIQVGYEYDGTETRSTGSFGVAPPPGAIVTGSRASRTIILWRKSTRYLTTMTSSPLGFGGWTMNVNHLADLQGPALFLGDGQQRRFRTDPTVVETIAGTGSTTPNYNENGQAKLATLGEITGLARAADGTLYFAENGYSAGNGHIRRISTTGVITTVAGFAPTVAKTNGMNAKNAEVFPTSLALAPDGTLYFSEYNKHQVWKITAEATPKLWLVAGTGATAGTTCPAPFVCGDGGLATTAEVRFPTDAAVAPDGAVFIADWGHARVRRVGPEGLISTYLGSIPQGGGSRLALREDGSLFVRTNTGGSLLQVRPNGEVISVAGPGTAYPNGIITDWCNAPGDSGQLPLPLTDGFFVSPARSTVVDGGRGMTQALERGGDVSPTTIAVPRAAAPSRVRAAA